MLELRSLAQPSSRFAGDDGAPDPVVRSAVERATGQAGYARALVALCASRLLLPVIATGDETDHRDPDRRAELAAVTLRDDSGICLIAFTGYDSLRAWNKEARPVLCLLDELAATVIAAGATRLLLDAAGPVPFVIDGETLASLANGNALVELDGGGFAWVRTA